MLLLLASLALQHLPARPPDLSKRAHTYSIVAYDSATGDLGVAVQSKFPNVGGLVPWAQAGIGAVATQSLSNTDYGEKGLELMALGATAPEALRVVMRGDPRPAQRQVGMVDGRGNAASWTGDSCFDWAGGRAGGQAVGGKGQLISGRTFAAQANIMVSDQTVKNMAAAFERSTGALADRLMGALKAGQAGGGIRGAAGGAQERRLPGWERPLHRYPRVRRHQSDSRARAAVLAAQTVLLHEPRRGLDPDHPGHREAARADPVARATQPEGQVARRVPGRREPEVS